MLYNVPATDASLLACPNRDLVERVQNLAPGGRPGARCDKDCGGSWEDPFIRTPARAVAAPLLYVVANAVPMLGLTVVGREASTTVLGGAQHLRNDGRKTVASEG